MASPFSNLKKKLMGSGGNRKSKEREEDCDGPSMTIGTPTNVKRLHHAEHGAGGIVGLPPELEKMLQVPYNYFLLFFCKHFIYIRIYPLFSP